MKNAGITQEKLAESLNMTQGGVQHWLAGTRQPTLEDIDRIAAAIGVPGPTLTHGLDENSLVHGLPLSSERVLRSLVARERTEPLGESFWNGLEAMIGAIPAPKRQAAASAPTPLRAPVAAPATTERGRPPAVRKSAGTRSR